MTTPKKEPVSVTLLPKGTLEPLKWGEANLVALTTLTRLEKSFGPRNYRILCRAILRLIK